jgi:hypothetical protein
MMFEAETTKLLQLRAQARGNAVLLSHIDQALTILARLPEADEDDAAFDELEVAIEALAVAIGHPGTRH